MPKQLRVNVGLTSPEIEEYKSELQGKWTEFFRTQFDRFVKEPLESMSRVGGALLGREGSNPTALDVLNATAAGVIGGAPGGTRAVSAVGQIKGLPPKAAKAVRKVMQQEMKARGTPMFASKEDEFVSELLRSTYFHGRGSYPRPAVVPKRPLIKDGIKTSGGFAHYDNPIERPDLRHARKQRTNLGEPEGISLTLDPEKATDFAHSSEIGRVTPLFGGAPEQNIIYAWTKQGGKVLNEAYAKIAKKTTEGFTEQSKSDILSNPTYSEFKSKIWGGAQDDFNKELTKELQSKGFKGILYSPHRFDEFELKMFDPKDVLMVDKRKFWESNPTFSRLGFGETEYKGIPEKLKTFKGLKGTNEKAHLYNWYRDIDMKKVVDEALGQVKPKKDLYVVDIKEKTPKMPSKYFDSYVGEDKDYATVLQGEINKYFGAEKLPSLSATLDKITPASANYDEMLSIMEGKTIVKNPWDYVVKEAEGKTEEALGLYEGVLNFMQGKGLNPIPQNKPVDLVLGSKEAPYIGGNISEDLLEIPGGLVKFKESRIGTLNEPIEDSYMQLMMDEARPVSKKPVKSSSLLKEMHKADELYGEGLISKAEWLEKISAYSTDQKFGFE